MPHSSTYRDKYIILLMSILIGHFFVVIGRDESLIQLWLEAHYYRDTLITALITMSIWGLVRYITSYLDKRSAWTENILIRLLWQVIMGLGIPILLTLILVFLFFTFIQQDILKSTFPIYEFPVSILVILMLNIYYAAYFFYNELQKKQLIIRELIEHTLQPLPDKDDQKVEVSAKNSKADFKTLIVNSGMKNIPIETDKIAYFFKEDDYLYLITFDREKFVLNMTLDELGQKLNPEQFFRANRQMIVNRKSCKFFTLHEFGKIILSVEPALDTEITISQKKATEFKEWLSR